MNEKYVTSNKINWIKIPVGIREKRIRLMDRAAKEKWSMKKYFDEENILIETFNKENHT